MGTRDSAGAVRSLFTEASLEIRGALSARRISRVAREHEVRIHADFLGVPNEAHLDRVREPGGRPAHPTSNSR